MRSDVGCRVYEQPAVQSALGETLRPGGLTLTDKALALCRLPAGARVLDVGCGSGASVGHLIAQHHLAAIGLDVSAVLLQPGRRRNPVLPLLQAMGERLPVSSGGLDAVLAECSLSLIADVDQALAEFWRVLKPGGHLILSDVYARNPEGLLALRRLPFESCLRSAMSQQDIAAKLRTHGFQIAVWQDHSEALKHLAGQLILLHGSMAQFWCRATSACLDPLDVQLAIRKARPGYYLLIAQVAHSRPKGCRAYEAVRRPMAVG
jgi:arsenite methyltransferase